MIPLFTYPLALLAALSIPSLAIIYLFRNRFRRRNVAGLFLWDRATRAREGGTVIRRMRTSWLFLLELLALAMLTLAATDPRLPFKGAGRTLTVILDDSASMLSGKPDDNPQERACAALPGIVRNGRFRSIRFLLAGTRPSVMDIAEGDHWSERELRKRWQCRSSSADLTRGIALAAELGGRHGKILVITDHAPAMPLDSGRVRWHAFGTPLGNFGFVGARRSVSAGEDRLFVAIANYTGRDAALAIPFTSEGRPVASHQATVRAGTVEAVAITLPAGLGAIAAQLPRDDFAIDNSALLLSEWPRPIGIRTRIADETLRRIVEEAIDATRLRDRQARPHLLITDEDGRPSDSSAWVLRLYHPQEARAFVGPFVVDHDHPIANGLSLAGVTWGASRTNTLPGTPFILAGNVPLAAEATDLGGRRVISLQLAPAVSTLPRTPAWPTLIWNIAKWRSDMLPGTTHANVLTDTTVEFATVDPVPHISVQDATGDTRTVAVHGRHATVAIPTPGIYIMTTEKTQSAVSANFCDAAESDLRALRAGSWGAWHDTDSLLREYLSWAWAPALIGLLALALHTVATSQRSSKEGALT